jgi:RNA recognition motif-containing protein
MNIYVGNLPHATTEDALRKLFEQFGKVEKAKIIVDRDTGQSRGFGFVDMPNDEEAQAAIAKLHGSELEGRKLNVNEARESQGPRRFDDRGGGPRRSSNGAGFRNRNF